MSTILTTYRGRTITEDDAAFIRDLIARHPTAHRRALSFKLCEAWNWVQANGAPRDMVCRGLMLHLHRAGHIELPPPRRASTNTLSLRHRRPDPVPIDDTPLHASLSALKPLTFQQVRRTPQEPLFNSLIEQHHYLGYTRPVGEHLKFLVYAGDRPVAALAWSSPPLHLRCRDRHIGWSSEARKKNLHRLAYNVRFLIPPWVQVEHLASHVLGRMARELPEQWQQVYGHDVVYLQTFVQPDRFGGTCYLAANWQVIGRTAGRGNNCPTYKANRPIKQVLVHPLTPRFREILCEL